MGMYVKWLIGVGLGFSLIGALLLMLTNRASTPDGRWCAFDTSTNNTISFWGLLFLAVGFAFQLIGTILS